MALRFWNRDYVGTHFGGSLYSMTDPFLMLMLIEMLGPGYVVGDRSASIRSEPIRDSAGGALESGIFVPAGGLDSGG